MGNAGRHQSCSSSGSQEKSRRTLGTIIIVLFPLLLVSLPSYYLLGTQGLTVKTEEEGQLVIARILAGGAVDRQGLLHVGDIIGEVNGVTVRSAEQLQVRTTSDFVCVIIRITQVFAFTVNQVEIARCREHIQLKILPSPQENGSNGAQVGQSPSTILASETINSATVVSEPVILPVL